MHHAVEVDCRYTK